MSSNSRRACETFGRRYTYSAIDPNRIPEPLLPFTDLCRECTALYRELRENFSSTEYAYRGSTTEWAYFDTVLRPVQAISTICGPNWPGAIHCVWARSAK
jgi:hypothetical protein